MSEQEVKLNVPSAARAGVEREMSRGAARSIHLHAMYFDTPSRELARAKVALRLRLEGDVWIQTLKMPGQDAISRLELNHTRPGPILDLSVYAGSEAEAALTSVKGELSLRYETDVQRVIRKQRSRTGTVEIAYDTGAVYASGFSLPICELEFELLSGQVEAIFATARAWHQRHGLVLDARSKSERGDALASLAAALDFKPIDDSDPTDPSQDAGRAKRAARIASFWAPRPICGVTLSADMTPARALAAVTAECLDQITRNAAALAEVDTANVAYTAGNADHVHQLRVGVRRLRSAWKLFEGIAVLPAVALQDDLKLHFGDFGANRDRDVLNATVLPKLLAAGMPELPDDAPITADDSETLARSKAFQGVLLSLLEWSVTPQPSHAVIAAAQAAESALEAGAIETSPSVETAPTAQDATTQATVVDQAAAPGNSPSTTVAAATATVEARFVPTIIPLGATPDHPRLDTQLMQRLTTWHRQIVKRGKHFASIDIEKKHNLRKRVKLLRYGLGFAESLTGASRLRAYRKHLAKVQDLLGEFNDMAVAHDTYLARTVDTTQAWFAVGWLSAEQQRVVLRAEVAFQELGLAPDFWKG